MVAVKMGGMMPPMGGMPQPMNMMPPPMPPQPMPMQQGAAPVAPQARSNAGRRKRFGDSLESMLSSGRQPVASDQMAGMNVFTGQMPRRPMPRGQMMGGTAMQPPVRRMMGGGPVSVPRETDIYGQPHMLAYINPEEADLLQGLGGMGTPGPGGVPQYNWFTDFVDSITGGGKSSNTGGRNSPRSGSSSSSSSPSYASPSNDPYAEDRGSRSSGPGFDPSAPPDSGGYFDSPKPPSEPAPPAFDISVSPGDDRPPSYFEDITTSITPPDTGGGGSYFNDITPPSTPPNTGVVGGGYDTIGGGSEDDVGIGGPPNTGGGGSYFEDITPPINDVGGGGDGSYFEDVTLPITGGGDDTDTGINLTPPEPPVTYYDIEGNPHSTQAGAAEANRLINQRKQQAAADAEAERKRMEQFAQLEAQAAADAERAEAARRKIAQQAAANQDPRGDESNVMTNYLPPDLTDPRGDEANVMTNYLPDDPINEGLGSDLSLDKKVKDGGDDDEEEKGFVDQFKDDLKEFIDTGKKDFEMALAAGLFGSRKTRFDKLIKAGYSAKEANDFLDRGEQGMKKMMDDQAKLSAQDGDDYKPTVGEVGVVDPCPAGMRLDPVAGICVPDEDTEEDEDSGDDKEEDTSDDELSGVVTTPPPPTSYLDNPIRMNRGGSVGLNRAADNFLAAMGG